MTSIPLDQYGTADYVTEIPFVKQIEWGGFRAYLRAAPGGDSSRATIFLLAPRWKGGPQPRLFLNPGDPGYADWQGRLAEAPEEPGSMRVVGSALAARGDDQWITHGPSPQLGG